MLENKIIKKISSVVNVPIMGRYYEEREKLISEEHNQRLMKLYNTLFNRDVEQHGALDLALGIVDENSFVTLNIYGHGNVDENGRHYIHWKDDSLYYTDVIYNNPFIETILKKDPGFLILVESCHSKAIKDTVPENATTFSSDGEGKICDLFWHSLIDDFVNGLALLTYVFEYDFDTDKLNEYFKYHRSKDNFLEPSWTYEGRRIQIELPKRSIEERFNLLSDCYFTGEHYRRNKENWLKFPTEIKERILKLLQEREEEALYKTVAYSVFDKVMIVGESFSKPLNPKISDVELVLSKLESTSCNEWDKIDLY